MKINHKFGIIILTAIIGFSVMSCGDGGDKDKLPPAGNGSVTFPITSSAVYYFDEDSDDGIVPYTGANLNFSFISIVDVDVLYNDDSDLDELIKFIELSKILSGTTNVRVTSSGLSLSLGTPRNEYLIDISKDLPKGFSVTSGLRVFGVNTFFSDCNNYMLAWTSNNSFPSDIAGLYYANKAGKISGKFMDGDEDLIMNLDLRQGWNTFIQTFSDNKNGYTITTVTGQPSNDYKWVIMPNIYY